MPIPPVPLMPDRDEGWLWLTPGLAPLLLPGFYGAAMIWLGFSANTLKPLQGVLPNFLVTSTITHFMCFFPPSFLSLCLKPGSCSEWLTLVRFGEPLKQFHYLHEIGMIWMNVLYRITVRSFHRIPCFDSVSPDVCLGGPSAVRSIWIKL